MEKKQISVAEKDEKIPITKINQSTQLQNMLAPLRVPGVNVISNPDGIIIAGKAIGIVIRREAKNRYHVLVVCSDARVITYEKDNFGSLGEAIELCARYIPLDENIYARKG